MGDAKNAEQPPANSGLNSLVPRPIPHPNNQTVFSQGEAQEREEEIKDKKTLIGQARRIEWWQFGVNAILAVIGLVAIFVYYGQLRAMDNQLTVLQEQLTQNEYAT